MPGTSGLPTLELGEAVRQLAKHYGPPTGPPTRDPFELILLENIAYLATPARRREAFDLLRSTIGTTPEGLLAATKPALERATAGGILKGHSAEKLRECARIAIGELDGDVSKAISGSLESATRALRLFPGIGEPGAEKILLFAGRYALLGADSNILRVLVRLGLIREDSSYTRMYAASQAVSKSLPAKVPTMQTAHSAAAAAWPDAVQARGAQMHGVSAGEALRVRTRNRAKLKTSFDKATRPAWLSPVLFWGAIVVGAIALGLLATPPDFMRPVPGRLTLPRLPGPAPNFRTLLYLLGVGSIVWYAAAVALPVLLVGARRIDIERQGRARVVAIVHRRHRVAHRDHERHPVRSRSTAARPPDPGSRRTDRRRFDRTCCRGSRSRASSIAVEARRRALRSDRRSRAASRDRWPSSD